MIRFLLRAISLICLALAVMFGVIDATRSVGVSAFVFTALGESWANYFPVSLSQFSDWLVTNAHPLLIDPVLATVLKWPTFAVFAGLSALFYILGYKRQRRHGQFLDR